jgi:uncharacterized protein
MKKIIVTVSVVILAVAIVYLGFSFLDLLFSYKLHQALGYGSVFVKNLGVQAVVLYGLALVVAILFPLALMPLKQVVPNYIYRSFSILSIVVGWLLGLAVGHIKATDWLLFFHHQLFHKTDPIFHLDYAFYVYQLPIYQSIIGRVVTLVFAFIVIQAVILLFKTRGDALGLIQSFRWLARTFGLLFVLFAVGCFLSKYAQLYNDQSGNFLYGPGFTQIHWSLSFVNWVSVILYLAVAGTLIYGSFLKEDQIFLRDFRTYRLPVFTLVGKIAVSLVLAIIGAVISAVHVHPNEQAVQAPYIKHTIDATRWGVNIEQVHAQTIDPTDALTAKAINQNQNLLNNVRINDIGQTKEIFNQLQSFKSYFKFNAADADRYNGQEVYVDLRQMDQSQLPVQTWINKTMVYTHGYGLAASPVNQFDSDGLPLIIAKDTPQKTQAPIPNIKQPEIYFGTMSNEVIAPTKEGEFDYPSGSADHTSHYKGGYNLPIQGNKLLLAFEKGSLKYLTSSQITDKSQLIFDRNIYKRVKDIAPFLTYDSDAYPVVTENGQIKWILDAYTETNRIPYAQSFDGVSYRRNSVKVVIDAYTGQTNFYVIDKKDPMIKSLMAIYPNLFTTNVPADIAAHFRYPSDFFALQAKALTSYHMTSANSFYNQEDLWSEAEEIYNQNQKQTRPPVYQMIQMPGETQPSFVLSELFTPNRKMNLNGWLVANNEPGHYGQLTLYKFPETSLFFGPMQAENQIDSDPNISSQLTLWNQQGSHVVRGNLLLVPIANTALYIEPIYLVADRQGSLPQLQRVIVDFNKKVYMGNNLADALKQMVNGISGGGSDQGQNQGGGANTPTTPGVGATLQNLANQANQLLDQYKKDTASGNLTKAGQDMQDLQNIISQMLTLKK